MDKATSVKMVEEPPDIEAIEKRVYFARSECNVSIGLIKERVLPICEDVESLVKRIRELEGMIKEIDESCGLLCDNLDAVGYKPNLPTDGPEGLPERVRWAAKRIHELVAQVSEKDIRRTIIVGSLGAMDAETLTDILKRTDVKLEHAIHETMALDFIKLPEDTHQIPVEPEPSKFIPGRESKPWKRKK